eukprot:3808577-Alexandrium_andersonii.AAC.1
MVASESLWEASFSFLPFFSLPSFFAAGSALGGGGERLRGSASGAGMAAKRRGGWLFVSRKGVRSYEPGRWGQEAGLE